MWYWQKTFIGQAQFLLVKWQNIQSKAKQSKAEFSEYLSKLGIPVIDYPTKELDNKLDYFKS